MLHNLTPLCNYQPSLYNILVLSNGLYIDNMRHSIMSCSLFLVKWVGGNTNPNLVFTPSALWVTTGYPLTGLGMYSHLVHRCFLSAISLSKYAMAEPVQAKWLMGLKWLMMVQRLQNPGLKKNNWAEKTSRFSFPKVFYNDQSLSHEKCYYCCSAPHWSNM